MLAEIEGPDGLWWLTLLTPELVLGIVASLLVVAIVGLILYRRARREGRWAPLVLAVQLETAPPGMRREVLKARMRLQRALAHAQRAVEASSGDGPRSSLDDLVDRARRAGEIIDHQLRILQSETDRVAARQGLAEARGRIDELDAVCRQISEAARTTLEGSMEGSLDDLRSDAARELEALQAGVGALSRLDTGAQAPFEPVEAPREVPVRRG